MIKTVAIFDTETSGLIEPDACDLFRQPHIAEMCIYKFEVDTESLASVQVGRYNSLFKIPIDMPKGALNTHHISNEMLENEPTFQEEYAKIANFMLGVDIFVAHNANYDINMLKFELMRIGKEINFPWPIRHICTVVETMHMRQCRLSLTALHEKLFNRGFPDAHRAESDVKPLADVFFRLLEDGVIKI